MQTNIGMTVWVMSAAGGAWRGGSNKLMPPAVIITGPHPLLGILMELLLVHCVVM